MSGLRAARDLVAEATADRVTWGDGTEYINVEDAARLVVAAEKRGAERVARAVMACIDPEDPPMGTRDTLRRPDAQFVIRRVLHALATEPTR